MAKRRSTCRPPRSPLVVAMLKRHGSTTTRMKDTREARGGSQRDDFDDEEVDSDENE